MTDRPVDLIERAVADALVAALPQALDRLVELGGPRVYSVAQVAVRLDISEPTVRAHIRAGRLKAVPHLDPLKVSASALEDFIAGRP